MNNIVSVWNVRDLNKHRRQAVLKKCNGDTFQAGQLLLQHYKKSRDFEVRSKARSDALYFFALAKQNVSKRNGKH